MKMIRIRSLLAVLGFALLVPAAGWGAWGQINRTLDLGYMWDTFTNRHYGGVNQAFTWPGGWWGTGGDVRHNMANYKGFVLGAKDVKDAEFPTTIWPYMVAQRDGWNDGEKGQNSATAAPDVLTPSTALRLMYNGQLVKRTFRQAYPTVTVDGVVRPESAHITVSGADGPYQTDVINPNIPTDLMLETLSWTRMGVSPNRTVYSFVDRDNDRTMFWHWRLINDGIWGNDGDRIVAVRDTARQTMLSLMFQWYRAHYGTYLTNSGGENNSDAIWHYYGWDYAAGASATEDMRLVWVHDGDQSQAKYNPAHGKQDDIGNPNPVTGALMTALMAGWQLLHYDMSTTDRRDDPAQPLTIGWQNYNRNVRTGSEGHEAKYNQMLWGLEKGGTYYPGPYQTTPGRGTHPYGGSWIKASNDPAVSQTYWPGKVLGVDLEVTDVEQTMGLGPCDIPPGDTLNGIFALGVNGLDPQLARIAGAQWLAGQMTDAQKDALVFTAKDSLFKVMRQAKSVYESATFPDGLGGQRYASTRDELETTFGAAITAGKLSLSPPAPATFVVNSGPDRGELSWTLNTTTGSSIDGWRIYRALADYNGDSLFTMIAQLPPSATSYQDTTVKRGFSYYYYLTTFKVVGGRTLESTMWTRTTRPMIPYGTPVDVLAGKVRVVPNPWSASDNSQHYAGRIGEAVKDSRSGYSRIQFVNLPGTCTLKIYTVDGDLIKTIDHKAVGSANPTGNETWNLISESNQYVVSGIYIFVVESSGGTEVGKFIIIR